MRRVHPTYPVCIIAATLFAFATAQAQSSGYWKWFKTETGVAVSSPGAGQGGLGANVALNKPVTVSSKYPTYQGKATSITDGTFTTVWYAYQGAPSYCSVIVDLGQNYSIGKIEVGPLQTFDYQIYGSTDDANYTQIASQTWPVWINVPVSVAVNGAASARYIKYEAHTPWNQYIGISGLRVYEWLASAPPAPPARPYRSIFPAHRGY